MNTVAAIGLEVHVQLQTRTKMFCGCRTAFGAPPNTQVCPVCLGYPGALPVINAEAIRLTVMTGLMLGSRIARRSAFDRKNYFYPDMPKNYQISQFARPLCVGGELAVACAGRMRAVRLTRIHLEEDVGKNIHDRDTSAVDFNRAGVPLMEIVTEPDLQSPSEAMAFLQALRQILVYGGISAANLEDGNLRCDLNCSLRPADQAALGTKVEIKNMNTFKGVVQALTAELARQAAALDVGEPLVQETRRFDPDRGVTESMRTKEDAHDYRYFPDPDLAPVVLDEARIEGWRRLLPELPRERCARLQRDGGLAAYDAAVLSADKALADFYEAVLARGAAPKAAANWIMNDVLGLLASTETDLANSRLTPAALASLIAMVEAQRLNLPAAKTVLAALFAEGGDPDAHVRRLGLAQISDAEALAEFVRRAIAEHPKSVADYRAGKAAALQFLIGQVMRLSRGQANPQRVRDLLARALPAP